jgi:dephospho-CoA kinase
MKKTPAIICITGGIGSGKSTIAKYIESKGFPVYNSDLAAKKISESDEVLLEIKAKISNEVFINNQLDRKRLGQLVFEDKNLLNKLNGIIHPRVKKDFENWLLINQNHKFVFKESALVFEANLNKNCQKIISVLAPKAERIRRVKARDLLDEKEIKNRMKNQVSDKIRRQFSDFCLYNKNLEKTLLKTDAILNLLKKM